MADTVVYRRLFRGHGTKLRQLDCSRTNRTISQSEFESKTETTTGKILGHQQQTSRCHRQTTRWWQSLEGARQ